MGYYVVESYMSKGPVKAQSNCICCAERRLIKTLFRECLKRGNKPHQFSSWVHRKYGELVVERKTCYGHGNSLPCVLCRKAIERIGLKWKAHDGRGLVLFSFRALLLVVAFFISSIFFVFEIMGMTFSTTVSVSTGFRSVRSFVRFSLNSSIVRSPPNSLSLNLFGAHFTEPIWLYIFFRMGMIFPHTIPPFTSPYLSIAWDFIQLHEQ